MYNFDVELWDDEGKRCNFYTVKIENETDNETDKFFETFELNPKYKADIEALLLFILVVIGENHGANNAFFNREEDQVYALPSKFTRVNSILYHFPRFPLRIFSIKIRDNIVILFNGGIKDGQTNQESSLYSKWREACKFAKRIDEAIYDEEIIIDEINGKLLSSDGSKIIML